MQRKSGEIQSVRRALTLLNRFTPDKYTWSVGDLARTTNLHKSVVARLMATMALEGYVVQDPSSRTYRIGPQMFAIGSLYEPYHLLHQVTRPILDELTADSGHSSCLGVPAGDRFMIIDTLEGNNSIRVAFSVGERPSYHGAAIGKVLLSTMSPKRVLEVVGPEPFPAVTPHTTTSAASLLAELESVREEGFARSNQESIIGVGAIAAPIVNGNRECIAGISVVYPIHLTRESEIPAVIDLVRNAAKTASEKLHRVSLPERPGHKTGNSDDSRTSR